MSAPDFAALHPSYEASGYLLNDNAWARRFAPFPTLRLLRAYHFVTGKHVPDVVVEEHAL
jgi:hypothetical protein